MFKKLFLLVVVLIFYLATSSYSQTVVWINQEQRDPQGVYWDQGFIDLLEGLGFEVINGEFADLTDENLEILNNADLILLSRNSNSANYATDDTEITAWNSIETPVMLLSTWIARNSRWQWVDTTTITEYLDESPMVVVDEQHPIFDNIPTDAPLDIIDESVGLGQTSFLIITEVGNGMILAKREADDVVWIVEWAPGLPFYDGTTQIPGGKRMLFIAGGWGGTEAGRYNLTDTGTQMFVNAVYYMLGATSRLNAFLPKPTDGQIEVPRDASMSWTEGGLAAAHNVYMGTSAADVNEATVDDPRGVLVSAGQTETTYQPSGLLDYGVTYYWRIDEVNDAEPDSPWKGDVWSFEVLNFPIVIDDFEEYTDFPPDEVWNTWIDGYGDATNGSTAGYPDPDFVIGEHYVETTIVHTGAQSMPIFYDNAAGISEVTRSLSSDLSNWNREGVVTLTVWYYGDAANAVQPLYVAVNGNAVVTSPDANAVLATEWKPFDIPFEDLTAQGVNLSNVNSITVGLGNKAAPQAGGGSGHIFIDDIRLYLP